MNEENKKKLMDANNSDPVFVTGVLYGMMFGIEMILDEQLPVTEEKNVIVDLINETVTHCGAKMNEMLQLIHKHQRVPDLMAVIKEKKETEEKHKFKEGLRNAVDGILKCLKGENNENK